MEWNLSGRDPQERLDRALRELGAQFPGAEYISRSAWDELFAGGLVQSLTGKRLKGGERIGDLPAKVIIKFPQLPLGLVPEALPCETLLEGKELIVVNKNCGIASYPLRPWERGTLANAVASFVEAKQLLSAREFEALGEAPLLEGGLLQRLDRDTSGCLSIALTGELKALMRKEFSRSHFKKTYLALVRGVPTWDRQHLEGALVSKGAQAMAWDASQNSARVECEVMLRGSGVALVRVRTSEGARHIVRVALANLGFALVGDRLYGKDEEFSVHQLHASELHYCGSLDFADAPALRRGVYCDPPESFGIVAKRFGIDVASRSLRIQSS